MKQSITQIIPSLLNRALEESAGLDDLIVQAEKIAHNITPGTHHQKRSGGGEYFWQFREYNTQDQAQSIDWRQSAKNDTLYVRQNEWQTPQSLLFWCQNNRGMKFRSNRKLRYKIEEAMIICLSLAMLAEQAEEYIRPLYKTERFSAPLVPHLGQFLYKDNKDELPDAAKINVQKNSSTILCGDFLAPIEQIQTSLHQLKAQKSYGLLIQVLDPAEIDLPYSGRVVFQQADGDGRQLINHVGSIRDSYKDRINKHIERIKSECQKIGFDYILHITSSDTRNLIMQIQHYLERPDITRKVSS